MKTELVSLGNCLERHHGGGTPSKKISSFWGGAINWASVKDISVVDKFLSTTEDTVTHEGVCRSASNLASSEAVIVGMRMSVGKFVLPTKSIAINQDLRALYPKLEFDREYLFYACSHAAHQLDNFAVGSTVKGINIDDLLSIKVSTFPLAEQKRIAEILSAVDEQIESLSVESSKQQLVFRGLLINYFPILDGGLAPSGWKFKKIKEVGEVITGNTPATNIPENYGGGHAFVSPGDISKEMFINKTEKSLTDRGFAGCRKLPKDSILTVCIGSTIGKIAIAGVPCATNQQINAIIPTNIELSHFYYFSLLSCLERQLGKYVGLQAVPIINKSNFSEIEILVPENSEDCIPIMKALKGCLSSLDILNDKAAKLKELKKSLMGDLLTGKTRVPS